MRVSANKIPVGWKVGQPVVLPAGELISPTLQLNRACEWLQQAKAGLTQQQHPRERALAETALASLIAGCSELLPRRKKACR